MIKKYSKVRIAFAALFAALALACLCLLLPSKITFADSESMQAGGAKENYWVTAPEIQDWYRGGFDKTVNTVKGEAAYGNDTLVFRVFGLDGIPVRFGNGYSFTADEGGVTDTVAEALNGLDFGTYYLLGTVLPTDEYTGLGTGLDEAYNIDYIKSTAYTFHVLVDDDYWVASPYVVAWNWGNFDKDENLITAVPKYSGEEREKQIEEAFGVKPQVVFGVYTTDIAEEDYAVVGLENFTASGYAGSVTDGQTVYLLSALVAGNYYLRARVSYGEGVYDNLDYFAPFTVQQAQNYWTVTPNVMRWTWGQFSAEENTITAVPAYPEQDATVHYGVFSDRDCTGIYEGFEKLTSFTGVDGEIAELLNALPAGTYWLRAATYEQSGNFTDLSSTVAFRIMQAQNIWETSPYVLGWKYGEYERDYNLIYAESRFGTPVFSIYTDAELKNALHFTETYNGDDTLFVLNKNTHVVPEYVKDVLSGLNAGKYYLVARVTGANDYTSINMGENGTSVPFDIQPVQNSWAEMPVIDGWREGSFENARLDVLIGAAKHGSVKYSVYNEKDKLLYIINSDGTSLSVSDAEGNKVEVSEFAKLPVGSYRLEAEVSGTDNYSDLNASTSFAVFEDSVGLSGIIAAVITFAVFDVIAAGACITLVIMRRRKIEEAYRKMIRRELNRR